MKDLANQVPDLKKNSQTDNTLYSKEYPINSQERKGCAGAKDRRDFPTVGEWQCRKLYIDFKKLQALAYRQALPFRMNPPH